MQFIHLGVHTEKVLHLLCARARSMSLLATNAAPVPSLPGGMGQLLWHQRCLPPTRLCPSPLQHPAVTGPPVTGTRGQLWAASAFVTAVDLAAVRLGCLDEIVSLGPLPGLFIHLTTVTACCLAPSLGSRMLSSAEQLWFSVIIQKYTHQLEKLPPEDRAEAEEADVKLIHLSLSQQPLPTHLPILALLPKGQAGFPSHPNLSTLEPATAMGLNHRWFQAKL